MATVKIVRRSSGFANIPADLRVADLPPESYEDTDTITEYVLPDGYEVAMTNAGDRAIYGPSGHCEIIEHPSGRPQLVGADPHNMPVLERA